jgi:hypothetical protein
MVTLSNVVCLEIHRNVIHRFIVQALQDPPLCSSTDNICTYFVVSFMLSIVLSFDVIVYCYHFPPFFFFLKT